ncbi:hypothetical protein BGZ80_002603 [Entomortierella chlamydospora]|uniref:RGS domain-containing protein n=1 Tax=Entomortierella chlamydospora TaxID=101097 RepID=A0A9P6MQ30_9FUNG|nr:hypothetical protein BGZ79_001574 [Entomortierella chlamydospora]KAG0009234.1 hypothetical protein BGZ80_002603 [Entomortierella chlamydospora]
MPTISVTQSSIQGPTMYHVSTLSNSPPSPQYFSQPSNSQRHSIASFDSRHSFDENDSPLNKPTLHQILLNQGRGQYTLDNFGAFLQSQFCYENLAFWLASRQYKLCAQSLYQSVHQSVPMFNLHVQTTQYLSDSQARAFSDLQRKMRAILDTFVLPSSPHELNLSDAVRCKLLRSVAEGNYHPQVLEQAREAIMDLMKCSSYPLFLEGIAAKRASNAGSSQSQADSEKSSHDNDSGSWRHKAKHHFKLVSKMLKRSA